MLNSEHNVLNCSTFYVNQDNGTHIVIYLGISFYSQCCVYFDIEQLLNSLMLKRIQPSFFLILKETTCLPRIHDHLLRVFCYMV
jgi:hypothetical protein